jgi:hypothetical protein
MSCSAAQAEAVRQSAAENLGQLIRMSPRMDQLAGDLIASARTAEPGPRDAYLTALRGALGSCGERLSAGTMSAIGAGLQQMLASGARRCRTLRSPKPCSRCSRCCRASGAPRPWTVSSGAPKPSTSGGVVPEPTGWLDR